ncbi:MAG: HAMP domain-containing sensor histidine kinase [Anaerolineae bacterium]
MQGRLLLALLTLNFLAVGGLVAWSVQDIETETVEQAEHELEIQSHLIAEALRPAYESNSTSPTDGLTQQVQFYSRKNAVRVTVLDARLREQVSSEPGETPGQVANGPEMLAAQSGTELHDIRSDPVSGATRLFVATAIQDEQGTNEGYVQLSTPMAPIYGDVRQAQLTLVGVGALILLVTAAVSTLLARQIARPVQSLTVSSEALARGRLEERVTPAGPDETRRLGHAFNQMAERISNMLARQKNFVANAAHELRSPLTSIRLRLELLQGSARNDPEMLQRYLAQMDRETSYLQSLVEQLLTLSALDADERGPSAPMDLVPLLHELADELGPLARQAEMELSTMLPLHLLTVNANAGEMRTVFRNLLDNAIKYSLPGGRITLQAEVVGNRVSVSVADTGIGIPAAAIDHIFDRFYRVDPSRSTQRSSGLGLALVRSLVQASAGEVTVASEEGKGSVFTVRLPVS